MSNDLRHAWRLLVREPGLATIAIITLALGLAANTAIFSVINGVLLRPLEYPHPGQLMAIQEQVPSLAAKYPMIPVNATSYVAWSRQAKTLAGVALAQGDTLNLTGAGQPALLNAASVTANILSVLGVQPRLGRNFLPDADQAGHNHEAILTDALWRNRFHADPQIIGRVITLNGSPYTVAGVLPTNFHFPASYQLSPFIGLGPRVELFVPQVFSSDELTSGGDFNYAAVGRLRPGVTPARAQAELSVIATQVAHEHPELSPEMRAVVVPLRDMIVGSARRGLWLLLAAVLALVLIICVNLANLLLARATAREREGAIRGALGASRGQLLRQALAETLLLALIGGGLALLLAHWGLRALLAAAPASLPRAYNAQLDGAVLGFTFVLTVAAGLLAGLLPAWRIAQSNPQDALRAGGGRTGESRARLRAREVLVGIETALSAMLLLAAGLLLTSFAKLINVPKGFEVAHILAVDLHLPPAQYTKSQQRHDFWRDALAATAVLPGVESSAVIDTPPLGGQNNVNPIQVPGDTRPMAEQPLANFRLVSPGLFRLLGIPLLRGRELTAADAGMQFVMISAATAQAVWPGKDPIGQTFRRGDPTEKPLQVAGVVGDMRGISLVEAPGLMVYQLYDGNYHATLLLRTRLRASALAPELRRVIWKIDPSVPIPRVETMGQIVAAALAPRQFQMLLISLFAAAALLLACLGIYGVVSYSVTRRTQEIGVRMALGARPVDLYRMVLRQGLQPVVLGLVAGIAAALALDRLLAGLLFEVQPSDPSLIVAVAIVLPLVALLACALPARRAARIAPSSALRYE